MNALPLVAERSRPSDTQICLSLTVAADAAVFEGHFPGHPVLPGVAQIDWAVRLADRYFVCGSSFAGLDRIKFHRIIQPPAEIGLQLGWQPGQRRVSFVYRAVSGGVVFSSGDVLLAPG